MSAPDRLGAPAPAPHVALEVGEPFLDHGPRRNPSCCTLRNWAIAIGAAGAVETIVGFGLTVGAATQTNEALFSTKTEVEWLKVDVVTNGGLTGMGKTAIVGVIMLGTGMTKVAFGTTLLLVDILRRRV